MWRVRSRTPEDITSFLLRFPWIHLHQLPRLIQSPPFVCSLPHDPISPQSHMHCSQLKLQSSIFLPLLAYSSRFFEATPYPCKHMFQGFVHITSLFFFL
ncbi:hypothetical protein MUK42_25467 [Musa troglodytarum]|uniref:Uncharacterized protein n=1 Tax=Musa troglodytarum TaxID=320322 RepID=A0A9E7FN54_9LILI|nr:hypothetical protein MUK42_25467 [Musa troglodytarum]